MLGQETVINKKLRERLKPETYHRVLNLMWDAMEGKGVYDAFEKEDLHITLLVDNKSCGLTLNA